MAANTSLIVTSTNFQGIKSNLKTFLKGQTEFTDYNFENSTMSVLLDTLAYNTYYQAVYLNMIANEMFLDTATLRENVVSNAKNVGYTPSSSKSAKAQVAITIIPNDSPDEIIVPAYTTFVSIVDGARYTFTTNEDVTIVNSSGLYSKVLDIYEGDIVNFTFTYSGGASVFELPNATTDTSALLVSVKENSGSTAKVNYTLADNLINLTSTSTAYFIQENGQGNFEVYFGDGVLGKALQVNNVVLVTSRVCNGSLPNNIGTFSASGYVGYNKTNPSTKYTASSVTTMSSAANGQDRESIESIRYNAPKFYGRQNRLVIADDYRSYLLSKYNDIGAVAVWGGEDNDPPVYGKVLISVKPANGYVLNISRKNEIINDMANKNVLSIEPVIVDPIFTFINPLILVNYNSTLTTLSADSIYSKVSTTVKNYETNSLGVFGQSFYKSKFNTAVDNSDNSIVSSEITYKLEKRIAPIFNTSLTYELNFSVPLTQPYEGYLGTLSSEGFKIVGNPNDCYFDDDGYGVVRLYQLVGSTKTYVNSNIGTIDYASGKVLIKSIYFSEIKNTTLNELRFFATSAVSNYTPSKNEIILFSYPTITLYNTNLSTVTKTGTVAVLGNISPLVTSGTLNSVQL